MAGGLFGVPFVFNVKCIIFSLLCMGLFLYKPTIKNRYVMTVVLLSIFTVAYVGMAWYDYAFGCSILPLQRGTLSITGLLKPPPPEKKLESTKKGIRLNHYIIALSHVLMFSPLLLYTSVRQNKTPEYIYVLLGALAVLTTLYHGTNLIIYTKH